MKLSDLSPEVLEKIKAYRYDQILEKHEGPENWSDLFKYDDPEFLRINGYEVLLPISQEHHKNITVLRCIAGDDGKALTVFLKDTTYADDPEDEFFSAGRVAICDKLDGEDFYLAIVYHAWYIVENK